MDENRGEVSAVIQEGSLAAVSGGTPPAPSGASLQGEPGLGPEKTKNPYVYKRPAAAPPKPQKPPKTTEELEYEAARRAHFTQYMWRPILAPIVTLTSICMVASLLLGLTNQVTRPLIEAAAQAEAETTRRLLLPEADSFTAVPAEGLPEQILAVYRADNGSGWVFETYGRGYGGAVPAAVAFNAGGTIAGVSFAANNETPGLGQKLVTSAGFAAQFGGLPAKNVNLSDIDRIASATVSTSAALSAVNAAIEGYDIMANGAAPLAKEAG